MTEEEYAEMEMENMPFGYDIAAAMGLTPEEIELNMSFEPSSPSNSK